MRHGFSNKFSARKTDVQFSANPKTLTFLLYAETGVKLFKRQTRLFTVPAEKAQLFTKSESCNDRTVSFDILLLEICKQVSSVTDHFEKAASGMMILLVLLKMFVKVVNSLCENSNLNLRRTGITLMSLKLIND